MANGIPPADGHKITLADAKTMVNNHSNRPANKRIDDSVKGVTFHKDIFTQLVNLPGCEAIRFYFALADADKVEGMHGNIASKDLVPTLVVVGVGKDGKDILTSTDKKSLDAGFENSWPYPLHGADGTNLVAP